MGAAMRAALPVTYLRPLLTVLSRPPRTYRGPCTAQRWGPPLSNPLLRRTIEQTVMAERRPLTIGRPELLPEGTDRDFRNFLHAFMVFSRRLEGIRSHLAQAIGVSGAQYEILSHLRESTSSVGLTVNEAAERLHCSGAFVTSEANKLSRAGLLVRTRDRLDARRVRLTLAPECERRFRQIAPLQRELNNTLFATLSARQFQVLCETFPKLVEDGDRAVALAEFHSKNKAISSGT